MHPRIWGLTMWHPRIYEYQLVPWVSGIQNLKFLSHSLHNILWKTKFILTITGTPSSRKYFDVVLFPVAAPPVSPIRNIAQALIRSRCSTNISLSLSKYLSSLFAQSKSKSFFLSILTFVVLTQFFNVLESGCNSCLCWFIYWAAELKSKQIGIYPSSVIMILWVHTYLDEVFWLNTYFKYWEIFLYKFIINEGTDLPYY